MPKQLRLSTLTSADGLTVKELKAWINQFSDDSPVVLKCGKNFRLGKMISNKTKTPILVGKRSALK